MKPGSPAWEKRIAELLALEYRQPFGWWYLSFAEPGRFLGAVIVRAQGLTTALLRSHALGINPGGQVASLPIGGEPPAQFLNRLLSLDDLREMDEEGKVVRMATGAAVN